MEINVSQIREDEGLTIQHQYPEGEPVLRGEDARLIGKPALSLHASREGAKVSLVGSVNATVEFDCDRCLMPLSIPVEQDFDLLYIPPTGSLQEEKELGDDDLMVAVYHNQVIDLDELVREQVELALPMARLCSQQCRGLCPDCGANLNQGQCSCSVEQVDPRWAALRELKSDN